MRINDELQILAQEHYDAMVDDQYDAMMEGIYGQYPQWNDWNDELIYWDLK